MAKLSKKSANDSQKPEQEKSQKTEFKSYQSFRLQKKIEISDQQKVPGSFWLFGQALGLLKRNFKLFLGMAVVYSLLYLLLVQGATTLSGLEQSKAALEATVTGNFAWLTTGFVLFTQVLGSSASLSAAANSYQFLVTLVASLALIWTIRQVYANKTVRVRDGFYSGMYPLIPFLIVLGVLVLELLPMAIGGSVFTTVIRNGIATTGLEVTLWATGFFILTLISLYMVASSLFALYIVSLPDMAPLQALRSARELVRDRRWQVMRKMLFLPLALVVIAGVLLIPVIMFATPLVGWIFFVFAAAGLAVTHSYLYGLYRSLI